MKKWVFGLVLAIVAQPIYAQESLLGTWKASSGGWPDYGTITMTVQKQQTHFTMTYGTLGDSCTIQTSVPTKIVNNRWILNKSFTQHARGYNGMSCKFQLHAGKYPYAIQGEKMAMKGFDGQKTIWERVR